MKVGLIAVLLLHSICKLVMTFDSNLILTFVSLLFCQTLPAAVHKAHPDPAGPTSWRWKEAFLSESGQRRACLLLQRV